MWLGAGAVAGTRVCVGEGYTCVALTSASIAAELGFGRGACGFCIVRPSESSLSTAESDDESSSAKGKREGRACADTL